MESRYHLVVSGLIALASDNLFVGFFCLLVGWLIDADHMIDYYLLNKRFILNPKALPRELSHIYGDRTSHKLYLFLHGFEWLLVGILFRLPAVLFFSFAAHLVMDVIGNEIHPFKMSFLWRYRRGFNVDGTKISGKPKFSLNLKMTIILISLSFAIWLLGDRVFEWSHIGPEMAGLFFLGAYLREIRLTSSVGMVSAYLLMSFFTFALVGFYSNYLRWELLITIFIIGSGFLFGYAWRGLKS